MKTRGTKDRGSGEKRETRLILREIRLILRVAVTGGLNSSSR
jgi:hypothetical protein